MLKGKLVVLFANMATYGQNVEKNAGQEPAKREFHDSSLAEM